MAVAERGIAEQGRLVEQAHRASVRVDTGQAAAYLQEVLSQRLVAYISNVKEGKTVARWATGEVAGMRTESEQRMRTAYEIAQLLTQFDSPRTVKAWFIGLNPQLGDVSPAEALHDGNLQEALSAARAFIAGG